MSLMRARTVTDVILGEAVSGTPEERYNDMLHVASVMVNRSKQLGVPLEDVVSVNREFNAYGKALPAGVNAYRSLAEQALTDVLNNGPVTDATFYATPAAASNLPKGLTKVGKTKGHNYYSDPYGRAIGTTQGYKKPDPLGYSQIAQIDENRLPTPSAAPRGILDNVQTASVSPVERGLLSEPGSFDMGRFGDPVQPAKSFDMARFGDPVSKVSGFDNARFGEMTGTTYDKLAAAATPRTAAPTSPFDSARFGTATQPVGIADLRSALETQKAQYPAPQGVGILSSAQAAQPAKAANASLADQYKQYGMGQAAMRAALAPSVAAQNLAADVAAQQAKTASLKTARLPASTVSPLQNAQPGYVDPVVSAQPASPARAAPTPVQQQQQRMASAIAASPAASMTPADAARMEKAMDTRKMIGGLLGGIAGGAVLGPVGGLLGGLLGRRFGLTSYFPDAPVGGGSGVGYGRDSLSDKGRDVYSKSGQFRDAVNSGKGGLW